MRTLLPGVTAERVPTSRLAVSVLSVAGRTGQPVLFVHGNVSSSLFWQPAMLGLPEGFRPLAVDLRGFGDTDPEPVDATRVTEAARCAAGRSARYCSTTPPPMLQPTRCTDVSPSASMTAARSSA